MSDGAGSTAGRRRLRITRFGCLSALAGLAALVVLTVLLIEFGPDSTSSGREEFIAGPAEEFARGDVNMFDLERILLVRFPDGAFRAFYDRSTKQQEIPGEDCRVFFDETAGAGTLEQIPGMRGAFVEECDGARSVWRVDGTYSFGSNWGDLDEFETRIDSEGNLVVITDSRICTRSAGAPGIPPFEERVCRGTPG